MENKTSNQHIETELSRDLGLTSALAIGIGTMIAAGIFTLSGLAIRNVGSSAIISFLIAAVVATFTALTYCEFVSIYPKTGEGYLYARKTYSAPIAYFVGWALFLGYASSCGFYLASLSEYFNEFIWHSPFFALSGIVALVGLTFLNIKGTKESGKFQIWVTSAKVVLLIWFIAGGLSFVEPAAFFDKLSDDFGNIVSTAGLVFITFFGFSAIAASAGEVKNPAKNIPKAIFISMGVVTILYTFVVLVLLFAGIEEYGEASMGLAAEKFLGPIGMKVIIGGALFSMISASNASIMAGSRVVLSMSQLGHLPKDLGKISAQTRTPIISTVVFSGAILLFILSFPLEELTHFADTVLLLVLILVNAALIIHRRKFPNMVRPFKVPLGPTLPIIGILANCYLLFQIFVDFTIPALIALAALIIGLIGFIIWKGTQPAETAIPGLTSHVAQSKGRGTFDKDKFRILVPLANPATAKPLINFAADIAKGKDSELILLRVMTVPDQVPLNRYDTNLISEQEQILNAAIQLAEGKGLVAHGIIRVSHSIERAILETSTQYDCNLTVVGWKGHTTNREKVWGSITDAIVKHARTDIILVKFVDNQPIKNILLPTAGGEHAQAAEQYGAAIAKERGGAATVCTITKPNESAESQKKKAAILQEAKTRMQRLGLSNINQKIISNTDVVNGIVQEGRKYDAIMVGAAGPKILPPSLFGDIPHSIAQKYDKPLIVVKRYDRVKSLLGRLVE